MLYQDLRSITAKQWKQRTLIDRKNDARRLGMEETEKLHDMRLKFKEIFAGLKPATNNSLQERAHLEKLKKGMQNSELKMASIILEKYLKQDIPQKNSKKSNMERVKNTNTVKNKS